MNRKQIFGILLLTTIAIYGVTTAFAQDEDTIADCPQDGTGIGTAQGYGYQRGSMDGSGPVQQQLKDGSGLGGMWGNGDGTGDCI